MSDPLSYNPEDAYYGPLGALAKRHREQIPLNLLPFYAMLLTAYGSLVGRRAMMQYCRDKHFGILFTAIVAESGCGKGTSWNIVRDLAEEMDPSCGSRIATDVASAPGLIGLVRDASSRTEGRKVIKDPGVADKRMLVVFEEMEILIEGITRRGSTLDKVMNSAWDGKSIENNARHREKATNPHLSFICQITGDAFRSVVGTMRHGQGCTNGFFNRFITIAAKKERSLPRGGIMPDVADLTDQLRSSLNSLGPAVGSEPTDLHWHKSTHDAWDEICEALDRDQGGLRARDKPKIMRVAMLNALSVGERSVMLPHLIAAKAFVLQCNDSAQSAYPQGRSAATTHLTNRVQAVATVTPRTLNDFHAGLHRKGYTAAELHSAISALVAKGLLTPTTIASKKGDPLPAWALSTPVRPAAEEEVVTPDIDHAHLSATTAPDLAIAANASVHLFQEQHIAPSPTSTKAPTFDMTLDGEPLEELDLAGDAFAVRLIDDMPVECFAPFVAAQDRVAARRIGGGLTDGFKKGDRGFRIRPCRTSPMEERIRVARRLKSEGDVAVVISERPIHVPRKYLSFEATEPAAV